MSITRRAQVLSEIAFLKGMAEDFEEDSWGKPGVEYRIRKLEEELSTLSTDMQRRAHAKLVFGGEPVRGSAGIDATFATDAISKYQELVDRVSEDLDEAKGSKQPRIVPQPASSRLHITGTLRGSFGFELAELPEEPEQYSLPLDTSEASQLVDTVKQTNDLLALAASEADAFDEAAASMSERVIREVENFFRSLKNAGATVTIQSPDQSTTFREHQIASALEKVSETRIDESENVQYVGRLNVLAIRKNWFEFQDQEGLLGESIWGKATDGAIEQFNALGKREHCMVIIRHKTLRRGSREHRSHVLLGVMEAPEQKED